MPQHNALTHAGGVVVRGAQTTPRVLLVRASRPPHDWVLPKGRIEAGETPEQTARREVREEAGVEAAPGPLVGTAQYVRKNSALTVGFFLMRYLADTHSTEDREVTWCSFDRAVDLVEFEDAREILRRAESLWRESGNRAAEG